MTFLEAAIAILKREGRPLHFKQLTEIALKENLLTVVGRTPEATMQQRLNDALKKEPSLNSSVNSQWAQIDKTVDQQAGWAAFMNRQFTDFFNSDMDLSCYVNHVLYQFDFATICKK